MILPVILRKEVVHQRARKGGHILVYQTSHTYDELLPPLRSVREHFIIYPAQKNKKEAYITFKTFSEKGFLHDLATCRAVITNGGFSLMSEAVALQKPIYSIPVRHQYEQIFNAQLVARAKIGEHHDSIDVHSLKHFLKNLPLYERNIKKYSRCGNDELIRIVDGIISDVSDQKNTKPL